jgi:Ni,Fe-hydrogenase III small subunit
MNCPSQAIHFDPLRIDLGSCLFCPNCQDACQQGAISFSQDYRLASFSREALISPPEVFYEGKIEKKPVYRLFRHSLKLRQVSAGGCNGCEAELAALSNVVFDASRFGIQFVASPRHADGIVVTGPVSHNMYQALIETYTAVPTPKVVIAVGACAISGGPFAESAEVHKGLSSEMTVDLYLPGCPPHPLTLLDGLLKLIRPDY